MEETVYLPFTRERYAVPCPSRDKYEKYCISGETSMSVMPTWERGFDLPPNLVQTDTTVK